MGYIYGIFTKDKDCLYIGSTNNYIKRFKQHRDALNKGKHTNKTLQKEWDKYVCLSDEHDADYYLEFVVIRELETDNTLIKFMFESLYNSIYKPKCNKCIIQQGRNRVILQRCNKDIAEKLINYSKEIGL